MGISPQLRLGKGGTGMKAEPERSGKTEAEQWACSGTVQPVRTAQLLGSQARGPSLGLRGLPSPARPSAMTLGTSSAAFPTGAPRPGA